MHVVNASNNEISSLQVFSTRASNRGINFHAAAAIGINNKNAFPIRHATCP
jgi:hypothetical protein